MKVIPKNCLDCDYYKNDSLCHHPKLPYRVWIARAFPIPSWCPLLDAQPKVIFDEVNPKIPESELPKPADIRGLWKDKSQEEWLKKPDSEGWWWFIGKILPRAYFSNNKEEETYQEKPMPVKVESIGGKLTPLYINFFLYNYYITDGLEGKWQKAIVPQIPKEKDVMNKYGKQFLESRGINTDEFIEGCKAGIKARQEGRMQPLDEVLKEIEPTQPCKECGGSGEIQDRLAWDIPGAKEVCPHCKGTGVEPK
jgi:hypothetical protein